MAAIATPLAVAAASPLLEYRDPTYIVAGFAGIAGLALMLVQPLLVGGVLPGLAAQRGRRVHRWVGAALVLAVVVHVYALWLTSPPDVIDALVFAAPTWFSVWGVVAMWAVFATATLAAVRGWAGVRPRTWRIAHGTLASVIVVGTVAHCLLIEGTMGTASKVVLCVAVVVAAAKVLADLPIARGRMTVARWAAAKWRGI